MYPDIVKKKPLVYGIGYNFSNHKYWNYVWGITPKCGCAMRNGCGCGQKVQLQLAGAVFRRACECKCGKQKKMVQVQFFAPKNFGCGCALLGVVQVQTKIMVPAKVNVLSQFDFCVRVPFIQRRSCCWEILAKVLWWLKILYFIELLNRSTCTFYSNIYNLIVHIIVTTNYRYVLYFFRFFFGGGSQNVKIWELSWRFLKICQFRKSNYSDVL